MLLGLVNLPDTDAIVALVVAAVTVALALFSVRRILLLLASRPADAGGEPFGGEELPRVTLIVPARNEAAACRALFQALEGMSYPPERLSFVLVSDGSSDATAELFSGWTAHHPHAHTIVLDEQVGKARALNLALVESHAEVIVVLDADLTPRPDFLLRLVRAFRNPATGGVAGYIEPRNSDATLVARYAAMESWVHQLVTSAGKDRLGLNPPTLGASAFRLTALQQVGLFPVVPHGVDVAVTIALTRAGWVTRFQPDAVVGNDIVRTLPEYWRQHLRWSRGSLNAIAPRRDRPERGRRRSRDRSRAVRRGRLARRLECYLLAAGYLDRLVLLMSIALAAGGLVPSWIPAAYLAFPAIEASVVLRRAGADRPWRYLAALALMFPIDAIASVVAALIHTTRRPARWQSPVRHTAPAHASGPANTR